jgi:hypothetical protein
MNTYTITLKTLCGKETTKVILAETPKKALLSMMTTKSILGKIKSQKPKP